MTEQIYTNHNIIIESYLPPALTIILTNHHLCIGVT